MSPQNEGIGGASLGRTYESKEYPTPPSKLALLHLVLDHYFSMKTLDQFPEMRSLVVDEIRRTMQELGHRIGAMELLARRVRDDGGKR